MGQTKGQWGNADSVETDLRAGLARAAAEGRWEAVTILNEQLRALVEARAGNVITLEPNGSKGGRRGRP
jgi:hypothetical protein